MRRLLLRNLQEFAACGGLELKAYLQVMLHLRSYLAIALAALLALTAHGAASARGMRDATGQMVICTGSGPVAIYVDAEGQPAAPPHDCPDCVSLALDAMPAQGGAAVAASGPSSRRTSPAPGIAALKRTQRASARAPPLTA